MTRPGIEPRSPRPLANTLPTRTMSRFLYIYNRYIRFGLVWFYGISTIVGYLMSNSLYTYILDIKDLVWFGFMVYQPL